MHLKNITKLMLIVAIAIILFTSCSNQSRYKKDTFIINNKFLLTRTSLHNIILTDINRKILIPPKISEISYDINYILIKQMSMKRKYPNNNENTYMIPDESKVNYWIVNMNEDKITGPLTLSQYEEFIKNKNISNLQFKDVKEYIE